MTDIRIVHILDMFGDIPEAHSQAIHPKNLAFKAFGQYRFPLADQLRFKAGGTVTWGLNRNCTH